MNEYTVSISESYSTEVSIEAKSEKEAEEIAEEMYHTKEIDLTSNCFEGFEITIIPQ